MISINIDGKNYFFNDKLSILDACKSIGIYIPTLCFLKDINKNASCRVCLVESNGRLVPSCDTTITDGMNIVTNSKKVRETRKTILELIAADHDFDCGRCIRNGSCELKKLCELYNIRETTLKVKSSYIPKDKSSVALIRDENKCIKCGRCIAVCNNRQVGGVLSYANRAEEYTITTEFVKPLDDTLCISCGQCSKVCPVGAIYERENIDEFWSAIENSKKHVVVQIAPAIRVSLAEEFDIDIDDLSGKLISALKSIGVAKVFDTNFTADLTIMEETNELINRIEDNGVLPLMTSCCPGWINYVEKYIPELIPNISSCKSPQQMLGSILKSYYATLQDIDPKDITMVSIMPCTAKKYEANRTEFSNNGIKDVDIVLTTRELIRLIKGLGKEFRDYENSTFDDPLGTSTGAASIFGTSGGVMEAALRTAYEKITGDELYILDFEEVRGEKGFKESSINLNGTLLKVAVINGIENIKFLQEKIRNGEKYCFVEVMCCLGGCIGGGGQPYDTSKEVLLNRMKKVYSIDHKKVKRKSHENPSIIKLYKEYLIKPGSHKAEELLHTKYYNRKS